MYQKSGDNKSTLCMDLEDLEENTRIMWTGILEQEI